MGHIDNVKVPQGVNKVNMIDKIKFEFEIYLAKHEF